MTLPKNYLIFLNTLNPLRGVKKILLMSCKKLDYHRSKVSQTKNKEERSDRETSENSSQSGSSNKAKATSI